MYARRMCMSDTLFRTNLVYVCACVCVVYAQVYENIVYMYNVCVCVCVREREISNIQDLLPVSVCLKVSCPLAILVINIRSTQDLQ